MYFLYIFFKFFSIFDVEQDALNEIKFQRSSHVLASDFQGEPYQVNQVSTIDFISQE